VEWSGVGWGVCVCVGGAEGGRSVDRRGNRGQTRARLDVTNSCVLVRVLFAFNQVSFGRYSAVSLRAAELCARGVSQAESGLSFVSFRRDELDSLKTVNIQNRWRTGLTVSLFMIAVQSRIGSGARA
jgi:hypothetical protein